VRAKESIPPSERLFRRLRAGEFSGPQVFPEAIDLRGSSCDREAYRSPGDLVTPEWPGVAWTSSEKLPTTFAPSSAAGPPTWDFFSVDAPEANNEAHCEIRLRRSGRTQEENDSSAIGKRPRIVREELKAALCASMRVILPPPE